MNVFKNELTLLTFPSEIVRVNVLIFVFIFFYKQKGFKFQFHRSRVEKGLLLWRQIFSSTWHLVNQQNCDSKEKKEAPMLVEGKSKEYTVSQ